MGRVYSGLRVLITRGPRGGFGLQHTHRPCPLPSPMDGIMGMGRAAPMGGEPPRDPLRTERQTWNPLLSSAPYPYPHDMHSNPILGETGDPHGSSGGNARMLRGGEPLERDGRQVRVFGGVRSQSGTGEAGTFRANIWEGDRDSLHYDEPHHSPYRSNILHRWRRYISYCHSTKGEADATLAGTQRNLDPRVCFHYRRHGSRMGRYYTLLRGRTLDRGIDRTRQPGHVLGENSLEGISIADRQQGSNPNYPLNLITSIILSTHTHITAIPSPDTNIPNIITNIPNNKHTITLDLALSLITGKNNTYPSTLCTKPSHKKIHNRYTHHLKTKREKELTSTILHLLHTKQKAQRKSKRKRKEEQ